MPHERIHLGTRARVQPATELNTDKLLELAIEKAPRPSVFDTIDPFFWEVRASSNRLDFYSTRMRPGRNKTLGNFARGLKEGVSYQDSHNSRKNGWGQSLDGRIVTLDERDPELNTPIVEAWGTFFTLPGQRFGDQDSDSFINAVSAGIWRDVSVGFFASDIECGLCGQQVFDWRSEDPCPHLPGLEYEEDGKTVVAWAWINDGELSEVSQVYDGASPGAAVVKAEQMSAEGALDEGARARIEHRYNTRIALPERRWALGKVPAHGERDMGKTGEKDIRNAEELEAAAEAEEQAAATVIEEGGTDDNEARATDDDAETVIEDPATEGGEGEGRGVDTLDTLRTRFAPHGIKLGRDPVQAVERLAEKVVELRGTIADLEPRATLGDQYKDDLIEVTLEAGVRAKGASYKKETYRGILEGLTLEQIRQIAEDYGAEGDAVFSGGRRTTETEEDAPPEEQPVTPQPGRGRRNRPSDPEAFSA